MTTKQSSYRHDRRRFLQGASATALVAAFGMPARSANLLPRFNPGNDPSVGWPQHDLLSPVAADSLDARLLAKPVLASRALGGDQGHWSATPSAVVVAEQNAGTGAETLRLRSPMLNVDYLKKARADNGSSNGGAGYLVEGAGANFWRIILDPAQDWTGFNRVAFELFVYDTTLDSYGIGLGIVDAAADPVGPTGPLPFTFVQNLVPGRWNRVVWEIPQISRAKVTEFAIFQPLRGPLGEVRYDVRGLALQSVDPEVIEGWSVVPGRIAYNHVGYLPGAAKVALVDDPTLATFDLLDAPTGVVVASFPVVHDHTRLGRFQRLDFSTLTKPGRYRIRAGHAETHEFAIREDLWIGTVEKVLNFFYADRCGYAVPGIHNVCHKDFRGEHEGVRVPLNGGWHDAGNGSQGSYRTSVCTEGLLSVYAKILGHSDQVVLRERVREEACWGLDWLLRTRFGKGYRITEVDFSFYSDGRLGDYDDVVRPAAFDVFENLLFVSVAADAARLLKMEDAARAAHALEAAMDDYAATMAALPNAKPRKSDRNSAAPFQEHAYGVLAALALHRATGRTALLEDAANFGDRLLACQHTGTIGDLAVSGFFYEDERRQMPSHEIHTSFADAAPRALASLCKALPRHPRANAWRMALASYANDFLVKGARLAAPYEHVPNTVWRDAQFAGYIENCIAGMRYVPPDIGYRYIRSDEREMRSGFAREYAAALPIADGVRLRTFPIPPDPVFHGATTIQLATTVGLFAAADALDEPALSALGQRQLDWVFGGNPFSNCLMYGEGHDFPSQFQAIARDMVGAVPVGMDNRNDAPFWPTASHFTFKEMWVVPAGHMLKALAALIGGAT